MTVLPDRPSPYGPRQPIIGISTYFRQAQWGKWSGEAVLLSRDYTDVVIRAGAIPVLLPPVERSGAAADVVAALDGLVLSGGGDIHPAYLGGEELHAEAAPINRDRDDWEVGLFRAALDRDLPVLGICRGIQIMAVALGGTLHQHLPDVLGHDDHRPEPGSYASTAVRTQPGSRLAAVIGPDAKVACHHHQAVRGLDGTDLVPTAWSGDGAIEALEHADHDFVLGVQWHPEKRGEVALFAALTAAASRQLGAERRS